MNQEEIRKQFEEWADENEYELETAEWNNKTIYTSNLTRSAWLGYQAALASKQCEISHLHFKIDSLMLEFCQDVMTSEQIENWSKHQKKVSAKLEESITKTVTTGEIRKDLKDAVCFANDGKERDWAEQEPVAWRHSNTHCLYETREDVPLADGDSFAEPLYLLSKQEHIESNQPKAIEPAQPKGE